MGRTKSIEELTPEQQEQRREYNRAWYEKNRERLRPNKRATRIRNHVWFQELKKSLACNRCGQNHPATLTFHHIDPTVKFEAITDMVHRRQMSRERILAEIAKCEVLCANCHAIEHWKHDDK